MESSPLKGLGKYQRFDIQAFLAEKKLAYLGRADWRENAEGDQKGPVIGTKVGAVIIEDKTAYPPTKDGQVVSNRYAQLVIKVKKLDLSMPEDTIIELVNPTAVVWGDYRNKLSITADDVRPVGGTSGKGGQ